MHSHWGLQSGLPPVDTHQTNSMKTWLARVQDMIETAGFVQLICGHTRSWRNQADSLLDQVWSNCQTRTVRHFNVTRGDSDHNVVGVEVATRDLKIGGHNITSRSWKKL